FLRRVNPVGSQKNMLQTFSPSFCSCDVSKKSESTADSHERPTGDRSCLHGINEETAVTSKERSREDSFVLDRICSSETEPYRVLRRLRIYRKKLKVR